MKWALSLTVMTAAILTAADRDEKKAPLMGVYDIVSGEMDGKPIPAEEIRGSKTTITADAITSTDKDRKEFFACSYKLDTKTKPWVISMVSTSPKKEKSEGIVQLDGETLKLCYAMPGVQRPTTFSTKKGQHCFVLKRVKELKSK